MSLLKRLNDTFASVKLTVFLIFLIAILSSLGTFLPQGEDSVGLADKWGMGVYHTLQVLGLTDTYHSWWFVLAIVLIAANLIACTIKRLPKVWRLHERTEEAVLKDSDIPKSSFTERWATGLSQSQALDLAGGVLSRRYGNLRHFQGEGQSAVWGEKHVPALWGAYIVHLGLMFLLTGGMLGVLFGYSRYLIIPEGASRPVPKVQVDFHPSLQWVTLPGTSLQLKVPVLFKRSDGQEPYEMQLDKFDVDFYPGTAAPKLFQSDVKLMKSDQILQNSSIRVNEPLVYQGVRFYQSSYGYEGAHAVHLNVHLPGDPAVYEVWAPYQKRFDLEKTGWALEVTDFYPEATMGAPGQIVKKGDQLNRPAIRLAFYQHGVQKTHYWMFFPAPGIPYINMSKVEGLAVEPLHVDPIAYTVLQVNHDPGVPFALIGALIVVLGVILSFYLFYRKVWVVVRPLENGSQVELVGVCKRNKLSFKKHFLELHEEMKAKLA
jgi:cytochrome c biogenesis protein